MEKIYFREMIDLLDVRTHPNGKKVIHSIKYVDKSGKLRFIPQCYVCGAGRMDNKLYRMRGIQPCCSSGNPEGHILPVRIRSIVYFNHKEVEY